MRMFRSILSACCYALAMAVGCVGMASASEKLITFHLRQATAVIGHYGAESAKFEAELVSQIGCDERTSTVTGSLTRESNGFRLSSMIADLAATISGVAKGKIGISAMA